MNKRSISRKRTGGAIALAQRERISIALLAAIALSVVAYAFLINATVLHIVEEQRMSTQINTLKQDIAGLEVALIEHENAITLDYAQERGFEHLTTRTFVTRDTNLSLRDE